MKLKGYFEKYNYDYAKIKYEKIIDFQYENINDLTIESRGDGFGIVVVHNDIKEDFNFGSIGLCPIEILLQLEVKIESWNEYQWAYYNLSEKDIIHDIYNELAERK